MQPRLALFGDYDLHHVEPEKDLGIAEQAQPGEGAARNAFPFLPIDGIQGPAKVFPRSRLHLHENQRVAIAANQVDLPPSATAKVTKQDFVPVPAKEFAG